MNDFDRALIRILVILLVAWAGWISLFLKDYARDQQEHQRSVEKKMDSIKASLGGPRLPDTNRKREQREVPPIPAG